VLGARRLFVKRDDRSSPLYGGSKVRALEFLLGAAQARGARGVATLGPEGSHHVLATALFGARAGFLVRAALFPQPATDELAGRGERLAALGAETVRAPTVALLPWVAARARWTALGGAAPYWIPGGGSSALGALGAVEGALEFADAVREGAAPPPDVVVVAAGSCGTAAGLVAGFATAGLGVEVCAVRVTPRVVASRRRIVALARGSLALLERAGARPGPLGPVTVRHDAYAPGYAKPSPAADAVMRDVGAAADFRVEGTYTARALSVLRAPEFAGRTVLFWNTYSAVDP